MDVFILKPNQHPLSPSFTSCISPTISLRPQFFGPEFRRPSRRRKCCGLGLGLGVQFHSPSVGIRRRFVFRTAAALDPQTVVVVVSFVAVSALTVFYFNYSNKKHDDGSNKISKRLDHTNSQQVSSILNHTYDEQNSSNVGLQGENSSGGSKFMVKEANNISHDFPDERAQVQYNETVLFYEEALKTGTSVSSGCDTIASSIIEPSASSEVKSSFKRDYVMLESSFEEPPNITVLSSPESHSVLLGSGDVLCIPPTERNVVCFDEKHKTEHDSELPKLMVETELIAASVPANSKVAGGNVILEKNYVLTKERDVSRYSFAAMKSTYKGLHSFYEANHYAMSSMENLSSTARPGISSSGNKCFSSRASSSISQSERFSAKDFLHAAEKFEAKLPLGKSETGPLDGRGDFWKKRVSCTEKEKTMLTKDDLKHLFPTSQLKKQGSSKDYPSQQLRAYHRFLKEGRLTDCLERLEYLERKGLLDMNNVYHMGFLRVCRSQKAVKEAFRFINLIPNPTLSTFNMLMSVCACSQDLEGGFEVLQLVKKAGFKADCKLYTTLISTCAKSIKVDTMFKVFHEMVNLGVEPNVHTYGALIDGCAKAGQVAKAFGAYGIMRSKNVKPDRVVFNALISACGQSGAVDRAFDVLSEMRSETHPIDPDHVTVGALMKACVNAGQVERAREIYHMIQEFNIKGTPEVYTIAVNSCSGNGDWEFACSVFNDMTKNGVIPDEMFFSALMDVAGHAGKLDASFEILQEARKRGIDVGIISYSSLMGACSNAKNWKKALELYEYVINLRMKPAVSMMNALITALCDGNELPKAVEILSEMKKLGLCPNSITYSILLVASEKKDDLEVGLMLLSQAKKDGISPNLIMCKCLIALCYRRFEKACMVGEPILSFDSGRLLIDSEWTRLVLMVYRETVNAGAVPTIEELSQVLGCLRLPQDSSLKTRLIENLGVIADTSKGSNLCSLIEGFGEYDPRAFSLLEEAASLGIVPCVSLKESPIVVDVYFLTVLKGLKHRLAAGVKLPNISIVLPVVKTQIEGDKTMNVAGRVTQAISALLRRLRISYIGNESFGKIRINGVVVKKWLSPKLAINYGGKPTDYYNYSRLGRGIINQQRHIRSGNLSYE
ncbi:Pentatricopeptide repeat-containing protein [Cynara cardunculus var. scolymus]|uniref:Pentatricopeptide repeat-containing protein n=1 Tax=Cynara cardunculus var. scolymus TaxID=59895 RepID=A0A103XTD7_CYNCS|nr:Pentatricopeptide repeat-containing protein [Cynara cardunculus var. scolymus]